jgi:hypothetical protein
MADSGTSDIIDGLGSGIGGLLGGLFSSNAIGSGLNTGLGSIDALIGAGAGSVAPYNIEGAAQIPAVNGTLANNNVVGGGRLTSSNPLDFESFAKNYDMSEGAKYLLDTATRSQDNSAAAKGGFYSGANERAQTGIAEGIANQDLLQQYQAMLSGSKENTAQEQGAFGNLFNQESLGEKAGATQSILAGSGAGTVGSLFGSSIAGNAAAQKSKGSGLGDLLGAGLSFAAK